MKINLQKIIIGTIIVTSAMSAFGAPKFNNKKSISVISREDGSGTRGAFIGPLDAANLLCLNLSIA